MPRAFPPVTAQLGGKTIDGVALSTGKLDLFFTDGTMLTVVVLETSSGVPDVRLTMGEYSRTVEMALTNAERRALKLMICEPGTSDEQSAHDKLMGALGEVA